MAEVSSKIRVVTVTVSDTRNAVTDSSGRVLGDELRAGGFDVVRHVIVPDEPRRIEAVLLGVRDAKEADAVVLTGGTGIAPRDQTFEAVEKLFDKKLDGFGEAFRRLSWDEVGPRAMLSRATAGVIATCVIYSLPGSVSAVRLGVRALIMPTLQHTVALLHGHRAHHEALS